MDKCINCKVSLYSQHNICPLCGKSLTDRETVTSETSYPRYIRTVGRGEFIIKKLFLFVTIVACAVSIFINAFTLGEKLILWSVIVSVSMISFWLIINITFGKRISIGKKILYDYGIISAFLIAIDIYADFGKWSTTYVIPFLTVAVAIILTIMAVSNRKNYRDYLGGLIAIFFVSFFPIIIFVFSFSTQAWTSFIAILYCLLTIVGLIIFSGRNFKQEIKKRFHF